MTCATFLLTFELLVTDTAGKSQRPRAARRGTSPRWVVLAARNDEHVWPTPGGKRKGSSGVAGSCPQQSLIAVATSPGRGMGRCRCEVHDRSPKPSKLRGEGRG